MNAKSLIAVVVLLLGAITHVNAQSGQHAVKVPFEFRVGSDILPPGQYVIGHESNPLLLTLTNRETHKKTSILVRDVSIAPSAQTRLVFSPVGNPRVVHQIIFAGEGHSHDLVDPADPNDVQ